MYNNICIFYFETYRCEFYCLKIDIFSCQSMNVRSVCIDLYFKTITINSINLPQEFEINSRNRKHL